MENHHFFIDQSTISTGPFSIAEGPRTHQPTQRGTTINPATEFLGHPWIHGASWTGDQRPPVMFVGF